MTSYVTHDCICPDIDACETAVGCLKLPGSKRREPSDAELKAAADFVDFLIPRADLKVGPYPAWHGWALRDAFYAGAAFARRRKK